MTVGLQLRHLRVIGRGKKPAELGFGPGCNVISGASNTGKTYILQCIDYALGGGATPKVVDESVGYDTILLEFEEPSGLLHKFERSLRGGAIRHSLRANGHWESAEPPTISAKHRATDKQTASGVLLTICGLWGHKVRTNDSGHIDSLSFRDVARLVLIDEKDIIDDHSPIFSGQHRQGTKELSVFNLILTGVDDSSVIAHETIQENRARRRAQLELLDRLIEKSHAEIQRADPEPLSVTERRLRVEQAIATTTQAIVATGNQIAELETTRQAAWVAARHASARGYAAEQLKQSFLLLADHYKNDLLRLNAILEADHYFSQLGEVSCPLCGATIGEPHTTAHGASTGPAVDIRTACEAEVQKIQVLLRDLIGTTQQTDDEVASWRAEHLHQASLFDKATAAIDRDLSPRAVQIKEALSASMERRDTLAYVELLQEKLAALQRERASISAEVWRKRPLEGGEERGQLVPQAVERFSLSVQAVLEEWKYPNLTRVTFNNERSDLIISGKDRASEGKGFRAIAYSAFIVGLLHYCVESQMPHPRFVVLDSPLVTYKRKDTKPGEAIPEDVARAFYESLARTPTDRQIVVFENEDPPEDVVSQIHYTHFSRTDVGRSGFFPPNK